MLDTPSPRRRHPGFWMSIVTKRGSDYHHCVSSVRGAAPSRWRCPSNVETMPSWVRRGHPYSSQVQEIGTGAAALLAPHVGFPSRDQMAHRGRERPTHRSRHPAMPPTPRELGRAPRVVVGSW